MVNDFTLVLVTDMWVGRNCTGIRDFLYCAVAKPQNRIYTIYVILLGYSHIMCLGIMMWASASMELFLLRYKQRIQNIYRIMCPRSSLETRTTQTILVLVIMFVFFYITPGIFSMSTLRYQGQSVPL